MGASERGPPIAFRLCSSPVKGKHSFQGWGRAERDSTECASLPLQAVKGKHTSVGWGEGAGPTTGATPFASGLQDTRTRSPRLRFGPASGHKTIQSLQRTRRAENHYRWPRTEVVSKPEVDLCSRGIGSGGSRL